MVRKPIVFWCFTKTTAKTVTLRLVEQQLAPEKSGQALTVHRMTLVQVSLKVFRLTATSLINLKTTKRTSLTKVIIYPNVSRQNK